MPRPRPAFLALAAVASATWTAPVRPATPEAEGVTTLPPYAVNSPVTGIPMPGPFQPNLAEARSGAGTTGSIGIASRLADKPGISLDRRGAHATSPVIRGRAGYRVATAWNGLPLHAAAATGTAHPLSGIIPGGNDLVTPTPALASVTLGPPATGGRIDLATGRPAWKAPRTRIRLAGHSGWGGLHSSIHHRDRIGPHHLRLDAHAASANDYRAGDGSRVDADARYTGIGVQARFALTEDRSLDLSGFGSLQEDVRNAALPLDTRRAATSALSLELSEEAGPVRWSWRVGLARSHPELDSDDRPLPPATPVARVTAEGRFTGAATTLTMEQAGTDGPHWISGIDLSVRRQDMQRRRELRAGPIFLDRIWPDIRTTGYGLFLERHQTIGDDAELRIGLRADGVDQVARATDAPVAGLPVVGGNTIRDYYRLHNGPDADRTAVREWGGAANVRLEVGAEAAPLTAYLGSGWAVAPPGATERFRAFLNALGGGFELGNPGLAPERLFEIAGGVSWNGTRCRLHTEFYHTRIADYVARTVLHSDPLIYGYRNRDARFTGLEATIGFSPGLPKENRRRFLLEAGGSLVHARFTDTGVALPEKPPGDAFVRIRSVFSVAGYETACTFGVRWTAGRANPDPATAPLYLDTAGHTLAELDLAVRLNDRWSLSLRVENLFDGLAYDYLQAPASPPPFGPSSGSLQPGDRIPLPGRTLSWSLDGKF